MNNIRKFIRLQLTFDTLKVTLYKFLIALVSLAAAALPWVLLIVRVTINNID